jgi:hypothetical protein
VSPRNGCMWAEDNVARTYTAGNASFNGQRFDAIPAWREQQRHNVR